MRDGAAPLEIVDADGVARQIDLDRKSARALYKEAYRKAQDAGFQFASVQLEPQQKLIEIVRSSRALALEGVGGDEDADDS